MVINVWLLLLFVVVGGWVRGGSDRANDFYLDFQRFFEIFVAVSMVFTQYERTSTNDYPTIKRIINAWYDIVIDT